MQNNMNADISQTDKFTEAARALECDESEEAFDAVLSKVVKHAPLKEGEAPKDKEPSKEKSE